ncbi:MAG: Fe2+-dependent dioxygenase [Cyanobacteria bacterium J06560_2]
MLFTVPELLAAEGVEGLLERLQAVPLVDGKSTAGWHAKTVKHNQQLDAEQAVPLAEEVRQVLLGHPLFQAAARPKQIQAVRFNRYSDGMAYGRHTDNALMNGRRTDLSFTLFLSDPSSYDGGELVVEGPDSEQAYKLAAGSVLVYPATSLHRVNAVTKGVRWAAIGWVQSQIRDAGQREILFELDTARRSLFKKYGKTDEFDLISKSLSNLTRQWVE